MPSQYNDTPLNDEQINLILEAANWAPTHRKTEPWRFKVLKGKSKNNLGEFLAEKYKDSNIKFSKFKYDRIKEKTKKTPLGLDWKTNHADARKYLNFFH